MSAPPVLQDDVAAVLRAAWWAYPGHHRLKRLAVPVGVMSLAGLLPAAWLAAVPLLRIVSLLGWALLMAAAIYGWTALLSNLLQQNHPRFARIVPGQVRALRHTLWAVAATLCALAAVIAAAAGGSALAGVTFAALVCAGVAMVLRLPALALAVMLPLWLMPWPAARDVIVQPWQAAPLLATGVVVMVAAGVLHAVVWRGGARHERMHKRSAVQAALWRGDLAHAARREAGAAPGRDGVRWTAGPIVHAYGACLRRALRRPTTARQRLALGLGPAQHMIGALAGAVATALVWIALAPLAWRFPQWGLMQGLHAGMSITMGLVALTTLAQWPATLWSSRREQVLLRLLPGAPQGGALNRWLALRLSGWQALSSVFLMGMLLVSDGLQGGGTQETQVALAGLILSPLAALALWRDWSCMRAPQGILSAAMLLLCGGIAAAAFGWVAGAGLSAASLVLPVLPLWLALAAWRWRVLGRKPAAWPVGRLGEARPPVPVHGTY